MKILIGALAIAVLLAVLPTANGQMMTEITKTNGDKPISGGSVFYSTSSTGKLASLNNLIGVFEVVIDAEGNFSEKTWEWK